MTAITANTGSNSWNTNGCWVGSVQPTAADTVTIPASAVVTIPTGTTVFARSLNVQASGTLAFASTTAELDVGDASGGSVTFSASSTLTLTGIGIIKFVATTGTTLSLTTGGKVMPNLTVAAGSTTTIQFADAVTATSAAITVSGGTLDTNGKTVSSATFASAGSTTRTLTLGATPWTITGSGGSTWSVTGSAVTLNAGTSVITLSNADNSNFVDGTGSSTYNNVVMQAIGASTVSFQPTGATFNNVTFTGAAVKTGQVTVTTAFTTNGALTFTGNSVTNRLLVASNTLGTARTITLGASATAKTNSSNVDFMDITMTGGAANERDFSAVTGNSGDALGNTGITFTTPATQTWSGTSGGNWSTNAWTSRVPLPQDNVVIASAFSASQTITADMPRSGANINWTGTTGAPTFNNATGYSFYGNWTYVGNVITAGNIGFNACGRGAQTFTSAGVTHNTSTAIIAPGGTYTLQDSYTNSRGIGIFAGTFTANNLTVSVETFSTTNNGVTKVVNMGTGAWSLTRSGAATTIWSTNTNGGALTLNASTAVVSTTGAPGSATTYAIATGSMTMPSFTVNGGANLTVQLSDAFTTAGTITLTAGALDTNSKTVTAFVVNGSGSTARTLTMGSSTFSLTQANGTAAWEFGTITNLTVTANTASLSVAVGGSGGRINSGAVNWNGMSWVSLGGGNQFISGTNGATVANLTIGVVGGSSTVEMRVNITITGTFTINGNSVALNRTFVRSQTTGTPTTITAGVLVCTNTIDFMDIMGAGAATWTTAASGATAFGNALGNSGITFTPAVTQTHTASAGGSWSDSTKWTSRVPLPQDNVIVDVNTTGTLTIDMPRIGADVDMSAFAGTTSLVLQPIVFGSFRIQTSGTGPGGSGFDLMGRTTHDLYGGVNSGAQIRIGGTGITGATSTYDLRSAYQNSTNNGWQTNSGTFNSNNFSITTTGFSAASAVARIINLGTSTITAVSTSGTVFNFAGSGTTSVASTTLVVSTAGTSSRTFAGNGNTFGTVTYTVASSPGGLTVTGANTFTTLNVGSGRILTLPSATTTTVTNWNVNGVNNGYLRIDGGIAGQYASAPDSVALSITSDIDLRVRVAQPNWADGSSHTFIAKWAAAGQLSYKFRVSPTGVLALFLSAAGSSSSTVASSVATGFANDSINWVRVTWRASDGRTQFFTASGAIANPIASDFTQLGTNQTVSVASIFDSTSILEIGNDTTGTGDRNAASFYRAQVRNGIDGTLVFDADFVAKPFGANTFTESSTNAATVTINGVLAQAGDGRVELNASTPASAATIAKTGTTAVSDYLRITDITVSPSATTWVAGSHSISGGNLSGWAVQSISTGGAWNATGTWWASVVPTAATDVFIPSGSTVSLPTATTVVGRSLNVLSGGGLTWDTSTSQLSIGDASGGAVTFSSSSTVTLTGIGTLNFVSTSNNGGSGWGFTTGGKNMPNLTFNGTGGHWVFQDAVTAPGATISPNRSTLNTNGMTINAAIMAASSTPMALTLGTSSITLTGNGGAWAFQVGTSLSAASSTITLTSAGTNSTFSAGGYTYGTIVLNSNADARFNDGCTVASLTRTGNSNKTATMTVQRAKTFTITGTLTLGGNTTQGVNRLLVQSDLIGTQSSFTATGAAVVISGDVDFMDMEISGSPSWTNSGSKYIGDALGNGSFIVSNRTTPATQTWVSSSGGNWSDVTKWTSRVPLPQDNVSFAVAFSSGQTVSMDMPRLGADISWTGASWSGTSPIMATASGAGGTATSYGGVAFVAGMNTNTVSGSTAILGRGTHVILSNGVAINYPVVVTSIGGTYSLSDALSSPNQTFQFLGGTLNSNSFSMLFGSQFIVSNAPTVNLGTSALTFTRTSATPWQCASSVILTGSAATFTYSSATATSRTFGGGGQIYGTLTYTVVNSPGALVVTGANTFTTLNVGSGRILTLPSTTTTTVTNWNVSGASNGYLRLPAVLANYVSTPDSAPLSITGNIDIRVRSAWDNWVPASSNELLSKWNASQESYRLFIDSAGRPQLNISSNGSTTSAVSSGTATGFAAGSINWVRVTWRASDGQVKFYTASGALASPATSDWTQQGSTGTLNIGSIFDSTSLVESGTGSTGVASSQPGSIYRVQIRNNILDDGTGIVFDADFTTKAFGANTFTEYSLMPGGSLRLPGINGSYASTPDSAAISVTTIDLRVKVDLGSRWGLAGANDYFVDSSPNASGYRFQQLGDVVRFGTATFAVNSSAHGITSGVWWLRVTQTGTAVAFYKSTDGVAWTALGTATQSNALTDSAQPLGIGANLAGLAATFTGNIYRVQIRNNILDDGTGIVFDADFTTPAAGTTSFTESSSNHATVTINGAATVTINGAAAQAGDGRVELNASSGASAAQLAHTVNESSSNAAPLTFNGLLTEAVDRVIFPGSNTAFVSTPDSSALSITGDIDIRIKAALTDWTPSSSNTLLSKTNVSLSKSYLFRIMTDGTVRFDWFADGNTNVAITSTVAPTVADGATIWLRFTFDVDNGAAGKTGRFYTSADGITWTPIGAAVTTGGTTSIFDGTSLVYIGVDGNSGVASNSLTGSIYRTQIRNNILDDGTGIVFDFNPSVFPTTTSPYLRITDSSALGQRWQAQDSVSVSNNTGWIYVFRYSGSAAESAVATDVPLRSAALLLRSGADASSITDAPVRSFIEARVVGETGTAIDVPVKSSALRLRSGAENANALETLQRLLLAARDVIDLQGAADSVHPQLRNARTVNDLLLALETGRFKMEPIVVLSAGFFAA